MRTTIDLSENLDTELRSRAAALGISYKEAISRAVSAGLSVLAEPSVPYTLKAKHCGLQAGFDWNHLNRLADEVEDEGI
jgi:hypothetical protein